MGVLQGLKQQYIRKRCKDHKSWNDFMENVMVYRANMGSLKCGGKEE
jgi:hypothetical protein